MADALSNSGTDAQTTTTVTPAPAQTRTAATPMHPRRAAVHETRTLGERAADHLASFAGSWKFIIGQTVFIAVWIALNSLAIVAHWDPYPWILLNLCMSTQAMYTGPIVMLSQNRAAQKDRTRDDTEAREVEQLTGMNEQQLVILGELKTQGTALDDITRLLRDLGEQTTASVRDPATGRYVSRTTRHAPAPPPLRPHHTAS